MLIFNVLLQIVKYQKFMITIATELESVFRIDVFSQSEVA